MRKKTVFIVLLSVLLFISNILSGCASGVLSAKTLNNNFNSNTGVNVKVLDYDKVRNSLIRFHVIANSDSSEDQNLKIKVKNQVIDYLYPYLNNSKSLDESRRIIKANMPEVEKIAEKVIKDNNYNYDVKIQLSRENFPEKSYGNIVLPQGNYEAFRIIIGSGQGKNWWCVMFPPLCFVDESKAEVEYDKVEERINSESELNTVSNDEKIELDEHKSESDNCVQIKFKFIEIIEKLFD
ncbi:stage II sporulation protein R [Clostridium sp. SM-530-WT-3G]|uniref:stage II sporulation protein R n=1 Tax=Clostridium sp. SM-530-WT-3G TaxID=2725303 RepID=UPI00145DAA33|nr:stage II sporulation protein R [Clostridium sp. SM-530-WT-3G]NME82629.1 stage II sporulation protein R [Clostridium sp. SM-530-WT-3G]